MRAAPCEWPVDYGTCDLPQGYEGKAQERAEAFATELLWNWTGRIFGLCPVQLRPCVTESDTPNAWSGIGWKSGTHGCGTCTSTCSCIDWARAFPLPSPRGRVLRVTIDGETLDPSAYTVVSGRLVRIDYSSWPTYQDLHLPDTSPGTWSITLERGVPVPSGGQTAAGLLALELHKAFCNDASCILPKRIQTITRQGVSMTLLDDFDNLSNGQTGIWLVDSWVSSIRNPLVEARVYSVDRRTW